MMTRVLVTLLLVAVLGLGLVGWRLEHVQSELRGAKQEATRLADALVQERALVRGLTRASKVQADRTLLLERQHKESSDALTRALLAHPDWAGQRVPGDVAGALGVQYPTSR